MSQITPTGRTRGMQVFENGLYIGNDVYKFSGDGAPTDGTSGTGAGLAGPGSEYTNIAAGNLYINAGTKASPIWKLVTRAG